MYNPLKFDQSFWCNVYNDGDNKYSDKLSSIWSELFFLTMKYDEIREIIYQSNPLSLIPVTFYSNQYVNDHHIDFIHNLSFPESQNVNNSDVDKNEDEWFMSIEYDPYDIDNFDT